ncbi:MAG: hypothetical protein NT080_05130 [Spirochaetes bacterium]|nr:hypothetical protein [Spirochaetota bacterium]
MWKAINNMAAHDPELRSSLNRNALSWRIILHSLQTTTFIALGRLFDTDKRSLTTRSLLIECSQNIEEFSKPRLTERKVAAGLDPALLEDYMTRTYEPCPADFESKLKKLDGWSKVFRDRYQPIRHKLFAHRDVEYLGKEDDLFGQTDFMEIESMLGFLHAIDRFIWELLNNGARHELNYFTFPDEARVLKDGQSLLQTLSKSQFSHTHRTAQGGGHPRA